jgi:5'-nucleotidase
MSTTNSTYEIIYESQSQDESVNNNSKKLNIIHFNDVYNIESSISEPVGGASRFVPAIEHLINNSKDPTLVFFSGDALSPSTISMLVKGKQMIEVLNKCHIACACLGNHDFGSFFSQFFSFSLP